MRLLVSGATPAVRTWYVRRPERLGVLLTPGAGLVRSMLDGTIPFAADNGCFKGLDASAFLRLLAFLAGCPHRPLFVVAPDVVADAAATLSRFGVWAPVIRSLGLPVALVGQDGLTSDVVPWGGLDAYFVGGSTEWKLSEPSRRLVEAAKAAGKHVHMGRVNSLKRIRWAAEWGCDTIDGTGFSWFSDVRIPKAIRWMDRAMSEVAHPRLFH